MCLLQVKDREHHIGDEVLRDRDLPDGFLVKRVKLVIFPLSTATRVQVVGVVVVREGLILHAPRPVHEVSGVPYTVVDVAR